MSVHRLILFVFLNLLVVGSVYARSIVLFDQGHSQAFLVENEGVLDLSKFAGVLRNEGLEVDVTSMAITEQSLEGVGALVISGPFSPLTREEAEVIVAFVQKGGRLALMLHIPQPLAPLMLDLGVMHSNGVIREQENRIDDSMTDFFAATSGGHQLAAGIDRFALFGAWAVAGTTDEVKEFAATSAHGWVDLNKDGKLNPGDAMQKLGVAVAGKMGQGEFVVFGDDAIFQNKFLHDENEKLARNLAHWILQDKGGI